MTRTPHQEYAAALEQYRRAMRRIIEAKRHIPPMPRDIRKQERREERRREASITPSPELLALIEGGKRALMEHVKLKLQRDIVSSLEDIA